MSLKSSCQNCCITLSVFRDIVFDNDLNNLPGQAYDFTAEAFSDRDVKNELSGAINTNTKIYFEVRKVYNMQ